MSSNPDDLYSTGASWFYDQLKTGGTVFSGIYGPPPTPTPPPVLTDVDVVRIVRAVLHALDEREQPSVLDVTPADVKRWMGPA